jgi:hypothetical protein
VSVSIAEILAGTSAHAVPLAGECAGYLVLAAADQAVVAPRRIGPREVHLADDGSVRVEGSRAAPEVESEADLRALLDALLLNASSATPALLRASRRAPGRGIAALVREIETALIPVNRAAAHRALARLERETERARARGRLTDIPETLARPSAPVPGAVSGNAVARPATPAPAAIEQRVEVREEIPSLLAPPVEPVPTPLGEVETRPEPIVARRSVRPPPLPKTPSPPPPVAGAELKTPFFGTFVPTEPEAEFEVVVEDEELIQEEDVEAEASATPDPTDPCLPALEDEPTDPERIVAPAVPEARLAEPTPSLLAETVVLPEPEVSEPEGTVMLVASEPATSTTEPLPSRAGALAAVDASVETAAEPHGETLALALAVEPAADERPPAPRLPMPSPRSSDVEELLGRMTGADAASSEDVRSSLKSLAGLESTPPPPDA